jgi:DNA polymerase-3 subunit gamma/tau
LEAGAPRDLLRRVKAFLEAETEIEWQVTQKSADTETIKQFETRTREELFADAARHPAVIAAMEHLQGAEIVDVQVSSSLETEGLGDNVIGLNSRRKA